jgi:DmsE family decaheme c-type cytochrome
VPSLAIPSGFQRPHRAAGLAALLIAAALAVLLPRASAESGDAAADSRSYIGEAVCRGCHALEAEQWNDTLHAEVFHSNPRNELQRHGCEACHGPGSAHLQNPTDPDTLISFTRGAGAPIETQNATCMECHAGGQRLHWSGSAHELQGLSCSDCHNPMAKTSDAGLLRMATVNATCFTCHPNQRVEFRKRSHMPLLEGKLECTSCHNPHGSVTEPMLQADSVNQLCYQCHADKRGPFLWEHAPVTESCLNCHLPHGSNREFLLAASLPFLCQQCHAASGAFNHPNQLLTRSNLAAALRPDERLLARSCINCHAQIHGSNHPSGARFHR